MTICPICKQEVKPKDKDTVHETDRGGKPKIYHADCYYQ